MPPSSTTSPCPPAPERTLSRAAARRVYDRIGSFQDRQLFYEGPPLADLCAHARFEEARAVVEFGCGTGRFAAELLAGRLPAEARYVGVDQSATMVRLARERIAPFGARAEIRQSDGAPALDLPDASCDRFVSTYVLDLLSVEDVRAVLAEARRLLEPGGLLCLAGLTPGETPAARATTWVWRRLHRLRPSLVGGCRPLALAGFLSEAEWALRHRRVLAPFSLASEVVVAARRP